jgi:hypothetical protein
LTHPSLGCRILSFPYSFMHAYEDPRLLSDGPAHYPSLNFHICEAS